MVCLTFRMSVSLVPFQIFLEKVMVLLFHHPHWQHACCFQMCLLENSIGSGVASGTRLWNGLVCFSLSELCVTQSVVEAKLQCPFEWKLLCKRTSKISIWSACPKFNLGKSTKRPHLWMSTFYHCFSAEGEGRCSAFLLETCYYALVKVFSILDIVFWRRVCQLWLCKGFWVLHLGALEMRSEWLCCLLAAFSQ